MKHIALISLVLMYCFDAYGSVKTLDHKIESVTVYTNGAQIEREAYYSVTKGTHTLYFETISPNIDSRTLQVNGTGSIIIMDAQYESYYPENIASQPQHIPVDLSRQLKNVKDSITEIEYEIDRITQNKLLYESEKNILLNNGMIKGQGKVNDSIQLLQSALNLYHERMLAINKSLFEVKKELRKWNDLLQTKKSRLNNLNTIIAQYQPKAQHNQPKHRIKVTVIAKEAAAKGKLYVRYIVSGASWTPAYDLRASGKGSDVSFTYKAWVQQNTQVDWKGAKLTLSTHDPYTNKQLPSLRPWFVEQNNTGIYNQRSTHNEDMRRHTENRPVSGVGAITDEVGAAPVEYASNYTQRVDQLVSASYKIDLPYDIVSGGSSHLVLIDETELPGDFKYMSVPKASNSVFAVTSVTDFEKLQLVPGQMQIFYDGAFIGEQYLNPTHLNDTLQLTLGADRFLHAERNNVKVEKKSKVIGNMVEVTYAYEFSLKNQKSETVSIEVQDQIPVTRKEKIEIEILEKGNGQLNEDNGIVTWTLKLRPQEKETFQFKYVVKYPKDQYVNLPPA